MWSLDGYLTIPGGQTDELQSPINFVFLFATQAYLHADTGCRWSNFHCGIGRSLDNSIFCLLCTYQCNAPLLQVRAEVGICILENYNSPPTGEALVLHSPTCLPVTKPGISVGLPHDRNVCFLGNDKSPPPRANLVVQPRPSPTPVPVVVGHYIDRHLLHL